jgi:hypothetical protein
MASLFSTMFGGGAEKEAAAKDTAAINQYGTTANNALTTGYTTGTGNINSAIGAYDPLSALGAKYNTAGNTYLDSLGINGPEAAARAQSQFTTDPGYGAGVDAGLTGINRAQALRGMSNSGNTDVDALTFAQNLQNQQYNNWRTNLQQAGQTGVGLVGQVAQGQAGQYDALANLGQQYASNQAGVAGNVASGVIGANNLQAAGEASGAKNLLGAGLSLASLATGAVGGLGAGLGSIPGAVGGTSVGGAPLQKPSFINSLFA